MAVGSLGQLTVDLVANTAGFERGMNQAERAVASATKAFEKQEKAADRLVGQIDPVAGALQRVTKQQIELEKHFQAGIIPTGEFNRLNKILEAQATAVSNTNKQFDKGGISAKQYAAALRNVPAQFTDIAVSLQAGQAPLTVLLQQGGQLKDMFGGVGGAAKALGGYVLGLVNPFTVAAAAVAVLALAYKQGSDEQTAFQNALILTGNAAGTSSQALAQQAQDISKTVGTVGAAAAVLTQLASSGKIPASQFDMIAVAALKLQEATGIAAEETVKNFEKLAKDPVKYSKELNESLNYLTASQYAQIDALQRQGDATGAANLAEQAYAEALTERASKITDNLGYVETAWKAVTSVAKGAWDAFLDIGREDTLEQKLSKLEKGLNDIAQRSSGPILFDDNPDLGALGAGQKGLQDEIGKTLQAYQDQTEAALKAGQAAADQKAGIDAYEKFSKGLEDGATKAQKLEKAIRDINKEAAAAAKAGLTISQADIDKRIAQVRDQYKPDKVAQPKAYQDDAGQKMLATLREQAAALQLQSETTEKLGAQAQALAKFNQQIADIKNKDILTADQKSLLASEDLIRAQLKRNVGLEQEVAARKASYESEQKLKALQESQDNKVDVAQQGYDDQLAGTGQGTKVRERLKAELAIRKDYANQFASLAKQNAAGALVGNDYEKAKDIVAEGLAKQLVAQQDYYNQVDELSKNFFNGTSEAWANYATEAADYSAQAADATSTVLNDATSSIAEGLDGIVKGTETVGEAFANLGVSMASSILAALEQIAAKWIVTETLQLLGIQTVTAATLTSEATKAGAVVSAEGTKTAAKLATDATSTASTLASLGTVLAANLAAAAETLASWAPAALVASIGSFGAAAVVGGAALVAAYALIKGFEGGGYTGDGGSSQPAGIVHKGEYVFTKAQTARIGKDNLAAFARRGYEAGGFVTDTNLGTGRVSTIPTSAKLDKTLNDIKSPSNMGSTTVNLIEDASRAGQVQERTGDQGEKMIDAFVSDLLGDGRTKDAMSSKFGLRSVGS